MVNIFMFLYNTDDNYNAGLWNNVIMSGVDACEWDR